MFIPLYLAIIPLLHYIVKRLVKIRNIYIDYLFPLMFSLIIINHLLQKGMNISAYTLSSIPILGDLYTPIIMIIDPFTVVFDILLLFIYVSEISRRTIGEKPYILLTIAMSILFIHSLDLLVNLLLMMLIFLNIFTSSKKKSYGLVITYIYLNIVGYLFTNTFNIGILIYLNKFNVVNAGILGLGIVFYILSYLYLLFIIIKEYPFTTGFEKDSMERGVELALVIVISAVLSRLFPILSILYYDKIFSITKILVLIFTILTMMKHSLSYLNGYTDALKYYELSYIPLTFILSSPWNYASLVLIMVSYILHSYLEDIDTWRETIQLSRIGIFPTPGFISRFIILGTVLYYLGILPFILIVLFYIILLLSSPQNSLSLNSNRLLLISMSSIFYLISINTLLEIGSQVFNLILYMRIVFGV